MEGFDLKLYREYRNIFGGRMAYDFCHTGDVLRVGDNCYSLREYTAEQLDNLMIESIESGNNVLLNDCKKYKIVAEHHPEYDY